MQEKTKQNDERRTKIVEDIRSPFWNRCGGYHGKAYCREKLPRNGWLKSRYYEMAKTGRTYFDIKMDLSVEYDISGQCY